MNKTMKVSDEVFEDLRRLQQPRETYSDVVKRLVNLHGVISAARPMLEGAVHYWEEPVKSATDKPAS